MIEEALEDEDQKKGRRRMKRGGKERGERRRRGRRKELSARLPCLSQSTRAASASYKGGRDTTHPSSIPFTQITHGGCK